MGIELRSNILVVKKIIKSTKAKFWSDLKVGDKFEITNTIRHVGGASSNGIYATYYGLRNLTTGEEHGDSQSRISFMLSKFELEVSNHASSIIYSCSICNKSFDSPVPLRIDPHVEELKGIEEHDFFCDECYRDRMESI